MQIVRFSSISVSCMACLALNYRVYEANQLSTVFSQFRCTEQSTIKLSLFIIDNEIIVNIHNVQAKIGQ